MADLTIHGGNSVPPPPSPAICSPLSTVVNTEASGLFISDSASLLPAGGTALSDGTLCRERLVADKRWVVQGCRGGLWIGGGAEVICKQGVQM